jgi:uncharacterized protein YlxW (UPF0749 family)
MTLNNDINEKIQMLELQTVKAVTELQKDVQQLTSEVCKLAKEIQKMTENYVTKQEYSDKMVELDRELANAKRIGFVRSIYIAILMTGISVIVTYEVLKFFK